jgi:hypothetical protein
MQADLGTGRTEQITDAAISASHVEDRQWSWRERFGEQLPQSARH